MIRLVRVLASASILLGVAACSSNHESPPLVCVDSHPTTCQPTYDPPTFATIHAKILKPTCASGTGTCHTSDAQKGGLVFEDEQASYNQLRDASHPRVIPGDTSCSLILERLLSTDAENRMPPGNLPLTDGEICTITKWIANGAPR
jgi:Planctomycete cytochrome C